MNRREIVHRCPYLGCGLTPCCGKTPFELPSTDHLTLDWSLVTCGNTQRNRRRTMSGVVPSADETSVVPSADEVPVVPSADDKPVVPSADEGPVAGSADDED